MKKKLEVTSSVVQRYAGTHHDIPFLQVVYGYVAVCIGTQIFYTVLEPRFSVS
jgi:hypothetical protein